MQMIELCLVIERSDNLEKSMIENLQEKSFEAQKLLRMDLFEYYRGKNNEES